MIKRKITKIICYSLWVLALFLLVGLSRDALHFTDKAFDAKFTKLFMKLATKVSIVALILWGITFFPFKKITKKGKGFGFIYYSLIYVSLILCVNFFFYKNLPRIQTNYYYDKALNEHIRMCGESSEIDLEISLSSDSYSSDEYGQFAPLLNFFKEHSVLDLQAAKMENYIHQNITSDEFLNLGTLDNWEYLQIAKKKISTLKAFYLDQKESRLTLIKNFRECLNSTEFPTTELKEDLLEFIELGTSNPIPHAYEVCCCCTESIETNEILLNFLCDVYGYYFVEDRILYFDRDEDAQTFNMYFDCLNAINQELMALMHSEENMTEYDGSLNSTDNI